MIHNYSSVVNALNQFASNHLVLKRFKCSFFEQFDGFSTAENSFPILYAIPNDMAFENQIDILSFRLYCVDILQKDRSNEGAVLNDTLLVLRDFVNWVRLDQYNDLDLANTPRAIPINNFLVDYTTGWYIDVEIEAATMTSDCAIPFSSAFQLTGQTCDFSYVSPFLTCATLSGCTLIQTIQSDINTVSAQTNTNTTNILVLSGDVSTINSQITTINNEIVDINSILTGLTASTPSEIVYFDTINPNLSGTTFDPDQQMSGDTLYVSQNILTPGQTWVWNGSIYTGYTGTTLNNTEWVLAGTSIDAGSNKTAAISRSGSTYVGYSTGLTSTVKFGVVTTGGTMVFRVFENGGIAEGSNTTASGSLSHAEGQNTTASGFAAHVEGGGGNLASGSLSHAEGQSNIASGSGSHAEGVNTRATGNYSHAEGQATTAAGTQSHSEGLGSKALANYSHAEGAFSTASGETSHAEGNSTTAFGSYSHSEGQLTRALGTTSHAEGNSTTASGQTSHAEGINTIAGGNYSHSEGASTTASGAQSHAEGSGTIARGISSHSEGQYTTAIGDYSHAGGVSSIASGQTSFVHGSGSTALGTGTVVLGSNLTGSTDNTTYVNGLNIFSAITDNSQTNLLVRKSNGDIEIRDVSTLNDTYVTGFTYSNNIFNITLNNGNNYPTTINSMTGLTVNGPLSATTYLGLPLDVYTTGTTRVDDTIYYDRNNGLSAYTSNAGLSEINNRLLINDSSTALISFGGISFAASATTYSIGAIKAWFVDNTTDPVNPTKQYVEFSATSGNTLINLTGQSVTYIAINSGGTISQSSSPFTSTQQRTLIHLGVIIHSNRVFINAINNQPVVAISPLSQLSDLMESIGGFNITGNVFSPNGANLNINKSAGELFKQGSNFINDNKDPHTISLSALTAPSNIRYRLQNGTEYADTSVVDPANYDLNGVLTTMTGTRWQIQRIYLFQSNLIRIQYGQATYASQTEAIQAISTEAFVVEQNILENGVFRGLLIVRRSATDLTDTSRALFIEASKFGSVAGLGSLSVTTLQQAYNNSTTPEITTNSTLGAVSIINGSGSNTNNVFEIINSGGTITSFIRGDGTLSATTYLGLPTDITVTGGTYTAGTATFTNNTGGTFSVTGFTTGGTGGLVYFTEYQNTTSPNNTVYVNALSAISTTTNADFVIKPKGTGAFIVGHIPDGTSTNGNKRGNYAVDINPGALASAVYVASGSRSISINGGAANGTNSIALGPISYAAGVGAVNIGGGFATNGATGNYSAILGGSDGVASTASGTGAVSLGGGQATGNYTLASGWATASGLGSVALGGGASAGAIASANYSFATNNTTLANGIYSSAFGTFTSTKGIGSRISLGTLQDISPYVQGGSQTSVGVITIQTATSAATSMLVYNGTAIALPMQNNEGIRVKGSIIGKQTASTNICSYDFDCIIVRGTTAASTVIHTSNMTLVWDNITVDTIPSLVANTSTGGLDIKSGGKAATTIKWVASIYSTESILA